MNYALLSLLIFTAILTQFQLASLKKGWITIEKKLNYDRYLWGYAPLTLMVVVAIVIFYSKGFEGVETALWLVTIWLAAIAFEPLWASLLKLSDFSWPANWAYNVWFVGLNIFCIWLVVIWFLWAKPSIEANTIWLFKLIFGA